MKNQLDNFLIDLVALCKQHGMAIVESGSAGISLIPWPGWADAEKVNIKRPRAAPLVRATAITPEGAEDYSYEQDGQL